MARRKNTKRIDPRYFLDETTYRDLNEDMDYWNRLFGGSNRWGNKQSWEMVTHSSLVGVYKDLGFTDPQRFIDLMPYEWQKPKATQALRDAGILDGEPEDEKPSEEPSSPIGKDGKGTFFNSAMGTAGDPARAKPTTAFRMDPKTGKVSE